MVDLWRNPHQEALSPFRRVPVNYDKELGAKRKRMLELYEDPDWLLQSGLADIEFEQGLYDHMAYGDKGPNELGLASLRHWNEYGGPLRYMDPTPGKSPYDEFYNVFSGDRLDQGTLGFTNTKNIMDMNLNNIIATRNRGLPLEHKEINWEDTAYSTQNAINDLFTHEIIHTNPHLDEFSDIEVTTPYNPPWNPDVIEHPIIYRNTMKYGANPAMIAAAQRYWDESEIKRDQLKSHHPLPSSFLSNYPNEWINRSKSDIADDIVRESTAYHGRSPIDERRRYPKGNYQTIDYTVPLPAPRRPKGTERFSTGGIVSLMV